MTALSPPKANGPSSPSAVVRRAMGPDDFHVLNDLWEAMTLARKLFMAARRPPAGPMQLRDARRDYLAALVAYDHALTTFRLPTPRLLRAEVRLLSRLMALAGG